MYLPSLSPYEVDPYYLNGKSMFMRTVDGPCYEAVPRYQEEEKNTKMEEHQFPFRHCRRRHHQRNSNACYDLSITPLSSGITVIREHLFHKLYSWLSFYLQKLLPFSQRCSSSFLIQHHHHRNSSSPHSSTDNQSEACENGSLSPFVDSVALDLERVDFLFQALCVHPKGFRSLCSSATSLFQSSSEVVFITVQAQIKQDVESPNGFSSSFKAPGAILIRVPLIPLVSSKDYAVGSFSIPDTVRESDMEEGTRSSLPNSLAYPSHPHAVPSSLPCSMYILDMNLITSGTHLALQERSTGTIYPARKHRCKSFPQSVSEAHHLALSVGDSSNSSRSSSCSSSSGGSGGVNDPREKEGNPGNTQCEMDSAVYMPCTSSLGKKRERSVLSSASAFLGTSASFKDPEPAISNELPFSVSSHITAKVGTREGGLAAPRLGMHYHRLIFFTNEEVQRLQAVEAAHKVVFDLVICSA